jgi:hypothetical protein
MALVSTDEPRETIVLPWAPADDYAMRVKRDKALAATVLREHCTLAEACERIERILKTVDEVLADALK